MHTIGKKLKIYFKTISKIIGYGIVFFSMTLKVPLIKNIIKSGSVEGFSFEALMIEVVIKI
jgi:hypothetical protein